MARLAAALGATLPLMASAQALRPDQQAFFELYKQLIETNTSLSAGSCTQAAAQIGERLKSAGFVDRDITLFSVPDHPKEGGI
ncbi:MAG: peptidase M20, partial [Sphingomonas sp.]|nr:peptidase M20 [Sphingomonas sp.]